MNGMVWVYVYSSQYTHINHYIDNTNKSRVRPIESVVFHIILGTDVV